MPIGNLTSQIFANIYLNELDRFVKHTLKVKNYLRYGDDFILVHPDLQRLEGMRMHVIGFLKEKLGLTLNPKNDKTIKAAHGLRFLGTVIFPHKRHLKRRNVRRIKRRLGRQNAASYHGLVAKHGDEGMKKEFSWRVYNLLDW